jgi:mRNA-degrading endonuclease RelE of RelBE toxin-antitoxin system
MSLDKSFLEKLERLPSEKRDEVEKFVETLLKDQKPKTKGKLRHDWAGALKDLREKYTSVELQHKISEWRIGEK